MIDVAVLPEAPWSDETDWEALATRAVVAAIERTPQADWLTQPVEIEVAVRLTTDDEVQVLNRQYRGKDKPTNVLSFPMVQPDLLDAVSQGSDDGEVLLGDIVLAYGVCTAEAAEKGISVEDHATHLIVHGTLHLLGHDHGTDADAGVMEGLERDALAGLGIADPYLTDPHPTGED
ncbi:rRNA maturation RNase YbeY [Sphingomonas sp. RS2018]